MVDIAACTINRSQRHFSGFTYLCPQKRTSDILFHDLSRIKIITDFLISCIFLQHIISLDGIQRSLFHSHNAIQISQSLLLLLQVYLLHQANSSLAHLKSFRIKGTNTIYLQFCEAIILCGKRNFRPLKQFTCFLLVTVTSSQRQSQCNND